MVYIDLNMVRAGVVSHPLDWPWCGYCEIQSPPQRYALIDQRALTELLGINSFKRYQQVHKGWIENELKSAQLGREPVWTQSLAVGHKDYVKDVKLALGMAARHRSIVEENDAYGLKERVMPYATHLECEMDILNAENTLLLE